MTSPAGPADTRSYILERLLGDSGEASSVIGAGRSMAERAVPGIQASLNAQLAAPVTVELRAVEVARVAEARSTGGDNFAMSIVASATSSDALTMVIDAKAVAIMVCALFGADPEQPVTPITRDFSQIELNVANLTLETIAQVLNGSGRRSLELKLPVPSVLTGGEAERRMLRDGPGLRIVFGVATPLETGTVTVMIPQRVLLTRGNDFKKDADSATVGHWRARFSEEVMRSTVTLKATMPLSRLTLGQIAGLAPGQVIELDETAQVNARLTARDRTLFVCEFGKLGQNYTVRIRHPFDAGQDFIDGLTAG
jgi:flagellar motor switch protein FliM